MDIEYEVDEVKYCVWLIVCVKVGGFFILVFDGWLIKFLGFLVWILNLFFFEDEYVYYFILFDKIEILVVFVFFKFYNFDF